MNEETAPGQKDQVSQVAANTMGHASNQGNPSVPPDTGAVKKDIKGLIGQLEALLDEYMVQKAPFQLPLGLKEFLVKVAPYLIIIFAVMALPFILGAIGLSTVLTPFAMMGGYGWGLGMIIAVATAVITIILEVMAVPGLFKRARAGWRLVFYASIVNVVGNLLAMNILGAIFAALIGWYVLFQIKEFYKN